MDFRAFLKKLIASATFYQEICKKIACTKKDIFQNCTFPKDLNGNFKIELISYFSKSKEKFQRWINKPFKIIVIKLAIYQKNEIWQLWMDYLKVRVKSFSFVTKWSKVLKHCFSLLNLYLANTWFIFDCKYLRNL